MSERYHNATTTNETLLRKTIDSFVARPSCTCVGVTPSHSCSAGLYKTPKITHTSTITIPIYLRKRHWTSSSRSEIKRGLHVRIESRWGGRKTETTSAFRSPGLQKKTITISLAKKSSDLTKNSKN